MVQPVLQITADIEADDSGTRRRHDFLEARRPVKHGEIGRDRRSEGRKCRDENEEFPVLKASISGGDERYIQWQMRQE